MSFISGALGLLGSLFTNSQQQKEAEKNRKAQALENQKNRDFNAEQAQLQRQFLSSEAQVSRDYNTQMVNEQNAYNAPSAQMDRLRGAGLNPNLVYSDIGNMSVGLGSSPQASGGASASYGSGLSSVMPQITNPLKEMAETRLINAQADNVDAQRGLTEEELKWYPQMREMELNIGKMNISLGQSQKNLTEAELITQTKLAAKISQEENLVMKSAALIHEQTEFQRIQNAISEATYDDVVAGVHFKTEQERITAENIGKMYALNALLINSNIELNKETKEKISEEIKILSEKVNQEELITVRLGVENDAFKFHFGLDKKYSEKERALNMLYGGLGMAVNCFGAVARFM